MADAEPEPVPEADQPSRPVFFWVMVIAVGLYLAVRLFEGALCPAAWLGWGSCPWGG